MSYGIHWFRRDLRVAGNPALQRQFKDHNGRVVGIFTFDKKFLSRKDFSVNRFQLFLNTLESLKNELRSIGSDLLVLDEGPEPAFTEMLTKMKSNNLELPTSFSWNRDYEPFALQRDKKIAKLLSKFEVTHFSERDHLIIEPNELEKPDGSGGYQVYTPFSKKWLELYKTSEIKKRVTRQKDSFQYLEKVTKGKPSKIFCLTWKDVFKSKLKFKDSLRDYCDSNAKLVTIPIPEVGSKAILKKLKEFESKVKRYGDGRDFPAEEGTSGFSMYLKNGSLTTSQVLYYFQLKPYLKKKSGADVFFSEIIWREFYYHILARHPRVEKESYIEKYKSIEWGNNKKWFNAWKNGKTGYPIVDAAMRELKDTGWMHNRARMIVASFLTKDLLIDWRWGEKYFMETLLDGDLAPNNGGWQWAASTGCDPQPYFRIFNPWLQSKKFDPEGEYIKKYVPELKSYSSKELHEPILNSSTYPEPIVDHSAQRLKALELYKKI